MKILAIILNPGEGRNMKDEILALFGFYAMIAQKLVILTRNIKVQPPNIFWWTFAFRTFVAAVSRRCPPGFFIPAGG